MHSVHAQLHSLSMLLRTSWLKGKRVSTMNEKEVRSFIPYLLKYFLRRVQINKFLPSCIPDMHLAQEIYSSIGIKYMYSILYGMCTISANFPKKNVHVAPIDVYGCRAELVGEVGRVPYIQWSQALVMFVKISQYHIRQIFSLKMPLR